MKKTTKLYILIFVLYTIGLVQSFDLEGLIIWLVMACIAYLLLKKHFPKTKEKNEKTITTIPTSQQTSSPKTELDKTSHTESRIKSRIEELIEKNPALTEGEIKEIILKEEKEKIASDVMNNLKIKVNYAKNIPRQKSIDSPTGDVDLTYTKVRKLTPNFVVLDFETTGLSHFDDEIIQVAAVRYVNFEEKEKFVSFVKPSTPIPSRITKITEITNEDVQNAPNIETVLPSLIEFLNKDVIVAHNASFDMKFLLANIHKAKLEYKRFRVVDTLSLARKYIDSTKNHKLPTLKSFLRLNHLNSHEALHDCYVTAELYKYCYEESNAVK